MIFPQENHNIVFISNAKIVIIFGICKFFMEKITLQHLIAFYISS